MPENCKKYKMIRGLPVCQVDRNLCCYKCEDFNRCEGECPDDGYIRGHDCLKAARYVIRGRQLMREKSN